MILFPAIDLKDGQCVRLYQGDMNKATVFSDSPDTQAKSFADAGFRWLHLVDLNGAIDGKPVNSKAVKAIMAEVKIPVQLGGGIRDLDSIAHWLEAGISRIILGTMALRNPAMAREACRRFPGQISIGIDARDGKVAVQGWAEQSDVSATEVALRFEEAGAVSIIYTDIGRDGTKQGPNIEGTLKIAEKLSTPVILSGGVGTIDDLKRVKAEEGSGIEGVIVGRALYDGQIPVPEALELMSSYRA